MIMNWFRRRNPVVTTTVADMMADISREVTETAKVDVDIQFYINKIQQVAETGEQMIDIRLPGNSAVNRAKKHAIAASLERLGFKVKWYEGCLEVRWYKS